LLCDFYVKKSDEKHPEGFDGFGTPLLPGQTANDAISKVIDGMTQDQQLDILANIKVLREMLLFTFVAVEFSYFNSEYSQRCYLQLSPIKLGDSFLQIRS
jgi:hypothetical protein